MKKRILTIPALLVMLILITSVFFISASADKSLDQYIEGGTTRTATVGATYTLSFNANGGLGSMASLEGLDSYILPACNFAPPSKMLFSHWQVNGVKMNPGERITLTSNTVAYAIWKRDNITKFNITVGGGYASLDGVPTTKASLDDFVYLIAGVPDGKVFVRWEVVSGNITLSNPESELSAGFRMPYEAVEVRAVYTDRRYDVSFLGDIDKLTVVGENDSLHGADYNCTITPKSGYKLDSIIVKRGASYTLAPTHYTFDAESGRLTIYGQYITDSIQIYAYAKELPRLTLSNAYADSAEAEILSGSESYTLPECSFTIPFGKLFSHWEIDGEVKQIGDSISITEDTIAYAVWKDDVYTNFSIAVSGGVSRLDGVNVSEAVLGSNIELVADVAPVGKIFVGWQVVVGKAQLDDSSSETTTFIMPYGDVAIKAIYRDAANSVNISEIYFADVTEGYTRPAVAMITITNSGEIALHNATVTLINGNDCFELIFISAFNPTLNEGESNGYSVGICPREGLLAGKYEAQISFNADELSAPVIAKISFTVSEPQHIHSYPDNWTFDGDNHWKQCECGEKYSVEAHAYDNGCDVNCDCGFERETEGHIYDNNCDAVCNECNYERIPSDHVFDSGCDTDCNVCSYVRETEHIYDNQCDSDCNECGETRETADHVFVDGRCECGEVDPDYVPHEHSFIDGKCECGEIDPDYVPHEHSFIDGRCECGEADPDYIQPPQNNPNDPTDSLENELSGGEIAAIIIGVVLAVWIGGFAVVWFIIQKKNFADLISLMKPTASLPKANAEDIENSDNE